MINQFTIERRQNENLRKQYRTMKIVQQKQRQIDRRKITEHKMIWNMHFSKECHDARYFCAFLANNCDFNCGKFKQQQITNLYIE